jgi:hypothetical protein
MGTLMRGVDLVVLGMGLFSLLAGVAAIVALLVAPIVARL